MMLYLADNLAYIPYTVIDEPLFLIHRIDLMVSVIGKRLQFKVAQLHILFGTVILRRFYYSYQTEGNTFC